MFFDDEDTSFESYTTIEGLHVDPTALKDVVMKKAPKESSLSASEEKEDFNWNREYQKAVETWQEIVSDPNASLDDQVQCLKSLRQITSDFASTIQVLLLPSPLVFLLSFLI